MMFARFAVYYTLPDGPLAEALADWLGWDSRCGETRDPPELPDLPRPALELTERPRKYGAHATFKPPFHLASGASATDLESAVTSYVKNRPPVVLDGLEVRRLGRFLALAPRGDASELESLAGDVVRHFDPFRAPPSDHELARRRKARLSLRQDENLRRWGYPHVMADFRFHITLTGPLKPDEIDPVTEALTRHLSPLLPTPFPVDALSLCGAEAETGRFHLIRRAPFTG